MVSHPGAKILSADISQAKKANRDIEFAVFFGRSKAVTGNIL
jgi:hypothetical protein